jgi:hypothetical protein
VDDLMHGDHPGAAVPAVVTLHLWGVPRRTVPAAVRRMTRDRRPLRRTPGLAFGKLLGTGAGRSFTLRDADLRHWGVLATWWSDDAAAAFEDGSVARGWAGIAEERLRVRLRPLASRGTWARRRPFGDPVTAPYEPGGPVAAVTRARIRPRLLVSFWRAVPPVAADLRAAGGLRLAVGIGEAPVGLQGTFSLWDSAAALTEFAYQRSPHVEAVRRTAELGWYAEELFARFAVLDVDGSYAGRPYT